MNLVKLGMGLGFGMMALGVFGRVTKDEQMGEASGSLIVFGAALGIASAALSKSRMVKDR